MRVRLGGITIRVAKDVRRWQARKGKVEPLESANSMTSSGPSPLESAAARQAMGLVQRLLATLDDEQRTVFVLAELEELTAPEIAEITGANVNTVSSRLRLARRHFDEAMSALQLKAGGM